MKPEIITAPEHRLFRVIAHMTDGVMVTIDRKLHLDGILAARLFMEAMPEEWKGVPPSEGEHPIEVTNIPLSRWRFPAPPDAHPSLLDDDGMLWGWCASSMFADWLGFGTHAVRKPVPVKEFAQFGREDSQVNVGSGPTKAWDKAYPAGIASELHFAALGDPGAVLEILTHVHGLGRLRNHGKGAVQSWSVVESDLRWDVTADGFPMRNLPEDWPGLSESGPRSRVTIRAPYWQHHRKVLGVSPSSELAEVR